MCGRLAKALGFRGTARLQLNQVEVKMGVPIPQIAPFWGIFKKIPNNNHKQYKLQTNSFKQIKV